MTVVIGEVTLLALGIALSPFPIIPALFLLLTPRPRMTGGAFLAGWAAGILAVASAFTELATVIEIREGTPTWASWTKVGLGAALALLAIRQWRSGAQKGSPAWMRSLTDATPAKALRLGMLLSAANPKIILLSATAGLTIGSAELGSFHAVAAMAVFMVIACFTVALPLLLHIVLGERILTGLDRARMWLQTHNSTVTALVLTVIAALLVTEGAAAL